MEEKIIGFFQVNRRWGELVGIGLALSLGERLRSSDGHSSRAGLGLGISFLSHLGRQTVSF